MDVAICVITRQRPREFTRLIRSLGDLTFSDAPPKIRIIVVENDDTPTAEPLCRELAEELDLEIEHAVEERPGIPFARNAAVRLAIDRVDAIAFVDDDQTVDAAWLERLIRTMASAEADVVTGPALTRLPDDAPGWLAKSKTLDLLRFRTGERRPEAYTHNVLARVQVFRDVRPNFDERMAHCGGTDTHFFRRVHGAGFRIVWADDALTWEWTPPGRATLRWVLQRSFRIGLTNVMIDRDLKPGLRTNLWHVRKSAEFGLRALVALPSALVRGRAGFARSAYHAARSLGLLGGLVGWRYDEYRPRDASSVGSAA